MFFINIPLSSHDENFMQNENPNNMLKRFPFRNKSQYFKEIVKSEKNSTE